MPFSVYLAEFADNDIEEIVVTARMVEESLQDVPVTVTSIGEEALTAFRIDDAVDLVSRIPALNIAIGASGQSGSMNLEEWDIRYIECI